MEKKARILWADDNEEVRVMVATTLEIAGYDVVSVAFVSEAIEAIKEGGFDIYIFDHNFPDGTGIDLTNQVRQSDKKTPIIIYSATIHPTDRIDIFKAGAQSYLPKQDLENLEPLISTLLTVSKQ